MNRNFDYNPINKNHYADFDEHGNPLTGNRNSLSRYTPDKGYGMNREGRYHNERRRDTNAAHAYGDMSRGTRYGEGESRHGGGSSYGHSYYGLSGNEGPHITQHDISRFQSKQYDAYGDSNHFDNRDHRFSNSFGRSSDGGYITDNRNRGNANPGHYDDSFQGPQYRNSDRGFDRGYEDYGRQDSNRGYSHDMNRDRTDYSNRGYMDEGWRSGEGNERHNDDRHQGRNQFDRNREW